MYAAYLTATLLAAALTAIAAIANFIGHDFPKSQADRIGVPYSWMIPLGALLATGAAGLLAGLVVPLLGTLAAAGLVTYFLAALIAHVRVRDRQLGPWALYFVPCLAALTTSIAYQ